MKTLSLSLALVLCFVLAGVSAPVNSMLGADKCELLEEPQIENLWVWPTEYALVGGNPSTLRNIVPGIWYIRFASNGYATSNSPETNTFTSNSFHAACSVGYSMTQVFDLDPGEYELSYDYFTNKSNGLANSWISTYEPSGSMWLYKERIAVTYIDRQRFADYATDVIRFSIPEGVLSNVAISASSGYYIDVWNVVLQKVN